MENNEKEMNFNYSECIKEQRNFGETIYYNICNNETHSVKWGQLDWCWLTIGIVLLVLVLIFIGCLVKLILFD